MQEECTLYTNKNEGPIEFPRTPTFYFKNVRYTDCIG